MDKYEFSHDDMSNLKPTFVPVPAPLDAPVHTLAESLGLVKGLRVEISDSTHWRCSLCGNYYGKGDYEVWLPDSIQTRLAFKQHVPDDVITEQCRLNAWNGHFTACCLSCAPHIAGAKRIQGKTSASNGSLTGSFLADVLKFFHLM